MLHKVIVAIACKLCNFLSLCLFAFACASVPCYSMSQIVQAAAPAVWEISWRPHGSGSGDDPPAGLSVRNAFSYISCQRLRQVAGAGVSGTLQAPWLRGRDSDRSLLAGQLRGQPPPALGGVCRRVLPRIRGNARGGGEDRP